MKQKADIGIFHLAVWTSIILMILKLTKVINISVWLVFSPILIVLGITCILIFIVGLITTYKDFDESDKQEDDDEQQ